MNVSDIEKCIPFYRDILELKQVADIRMCNEFLTTVQGKKVDYRIVKFEALGGFIVELHKNFLEDIRPLETNSLQDTGLRHYAYEVDDVDTFYNHVKTMGCQTVNPPCTSDDGSMRLFFVRDPEQNLVEIMQIYR
jgi:catechol 2,3-dioxygenase-like lactoylglutathione lyase family enzyme